MRTWLVLDCSYLAWRAFYSTGSLSFEDKSTGVLYGFMRDILQFQERLGTKNMVFCFDRGPYLRERDYPSYKENRIVNQNLTEEKKEMISQVREQLRLLRTEYLFDLGFRNVCSAKGYEADDVVASICLNLPGTDEAVIVGSDKDLYQLLSSRVIMWNPNSKKAITQDSFEKQYGVTPTQWVDVKAIAGCSGDGVQGIKGAGELTAAKFLNGKLSNKSKAFQNIIAGNSIWDRNRHLVKLPYGGCPKFKLVEDKLDRNAWIALCDLLGMKSLRDLV